MLDSPISGSPAMVAPRLATTFASGEEASVAKVRPVLDAISGPWVYTGAFGTGARLKYIANLLLAVHTVAAAEAMELARRSGLDLDLVQRTLDDSIGSSAIWRQRGPLMRERAWSPAPGPITTLHPILEQIQDCAAETGLAAPVFASAKAVFDQALADGWGAPRHRVRLRPDLGPGRPQPRRAFMTWQLSTYERDGQYRAGRAARGRLAGRADRAEAVAHDDGAAG